MIEYFQNKLVDTIHFMEILSLKDSVEKDTFFRKLPILAEQLPRQIVLKKVASKLQHSFSWCASWVSHSFFIRQLLPLLASALEFGSAAAPALTALLKMGSWLSTEEFSAKVISLSRCYGWYFPVETILNFYLVVFFLSFCLIYLFLYLKWIWFFSFWVWPLWCLDSTYNSKTICLEWSSYQNWTPATYWSIWRIIVIPNGWWTGMKLMIIIASINDETSLCWWEEKDVSIR